MEAPKRFPVCDHNSIRPVKRTTLVKLDNEQIPEVLAYRRGEGHLFLVLQPKTNGSRHPTESHIHPRSVEIMRTLVPDGSLASVFEAGIYFVPSRICSRFLNSEGLLKEACRGR